MRRLDGYWVAAAVRLTLGVTHTSPLMGLAVQQARWWCCGPVGLWVAASSTLTVRVDKIAAILTALAAAVLVAPWS
jgi:hypothetical protein